MDTMTRRQPVNVRIDASLVAALDRIRVADGVPVSEQIRRGIVLWLKSKGAAPMPDARKAPKPKAK